MATVATLIEAVCAYRNALRAEDNDAIMETANTLDTVLQTVAIDPAHRETIVGTYSDERDFDEAAGELEDVLEQLLFDEQYEFVRTTYGKEAATKANYGWGVDCNETGLSIASKVYGFGVVKTNLRYADGHYTTAAD